MCIRDSTGGAGRLFHTTSNSWDLTGDGMALALQAGLQLEDSEFVQFHPTGLAHTGILLSEAARAEGGVLRNADGEAFMEKYAPGGYLKLWFPHSKNARQLKELQAIIADEVRLRSIFHQMFEEEKR